MNTSRTFLLALLTAAVASAPVGAQNDLAAPDEGPIVVELSDLPLLPEGGFPPSLLHNNGPIVNSPGTGQGGADESVLQNVTLGMSTLGFDHSVGTGWRVADDFTSTSLDWHIEGIITYAYQTGAGPGPSTISAANVCIWNGEPGNGGVVVWGDCASNQLIESVDTGILRVTEQTSGTNVDRAIMRDSIASDGLFHFWPRTYWLDWQVDGTLASGPQVPPVTINGSCVTGNALQSSDGGVTWAPAIDAATGCRQGFPFRLYGWIAIPVELISFEATANSTDALLTWETASETNNAGFEVEHQAPGASDFRALDFVEGHGTTTEAHAYHYTTAGLLPGTHAFRLRQVDFDGAFEYSDEVEVNVGVPGTHSLSAAYPNPFNPSTTFTLAVARDQHVTVALYDALGRRVAALFDGPMAAGEAHALRIDGAGLPSGLYVARVVGETFTDAVRVSLVK